MTVQAPAYLLTYCIRWWSWWWFFFFSPFVWPNNRDENLCLFVWGYACMYV